MGIETPNVKGGLAAVGRWGMATKTCDTCKSAAAAIFCRTDSAFMCLNCDARIHSNSRHERVWMCEVCEQAPAAVTCKADAAALCESCDSDIHSANPLARRHERVPVQPFFDSADSIVKSSPFSFLVPPTTTTTDHNDHSNSNCQEQQQQQDVVETWLTMETNQVKTGDLFFSEMDPFIDFQYQNSFHDAAMDSVVPVQTKPAAFPVINNEICFDVDFCRSKQLPTFSYQTQSHSHSVSSSSVDVGVVPDGNSYSDISYTLGQPNAPMWATTAGNNNNNQAASQGQVGGILDREARVLRYREKRKNRKFEKTIRYASRKAYAESRPRIKGRFAKRNETDNNNDAVVDLMFNSAPSVATAAAAAFMYDTQYGIVPSF